MKPCDQDRRPQPRATPDFKGGGAKDVMTISSRSKIFNIRFTGERTVHADDRI